LTVCPVDTNS